jgi:hypothetical protein
LYQNFIKVLDVKKSYGRLRLYTSHNKFIVRPSGVINPSLVKIDLKFAKEFGEKSLDWDYIVDTSEVKFANPINLIFLSNVKSLPNLNRYIIYAPSLITQCLVLVGKLFMMPDIVIVSKSKYQILLD